MKNKPFEFLAKVSDESILFAITNEHPQTIAVIVSYLHIKQAACIIENLPPEQRLAVIRRIASMRQIELAVIKIVEEELKSQIADRKFVNAGGIDNIAETLTVVNSSTAQHILDNLAVDAPDLVNDIRQSMHVIKKMQNRGKCR